MSRPRALDLFCGAGGVSVGLARAGFEVTGVDIDPRTEKGWRRGMERHAPEAIGGFVVADALTFPLAGFDFIWASPPCQRYSQATRITGRAEEHPDLVAPVRDWLTGSGAPWVIENVPGAPLGGYLIVLCGSMFGLRTPDGRAELRRHRLFESSLALLAPSCRHVFCESGRAMSVSGHAAEIPPSNWGKRPVITVTGNKPNSQNTPRVLTVTGRKGLPGVSDERRNQVRETYSVEDARHAMGIDWMVMRDLSQAIPPAYAEFIGRQVLGEVPIGIQAPLWWGWAG